MGCKRPAPSRGAEPAPVVTLVGCARVLAGPMCVVDASRTAHLRVDPPQREVRVAVDGAEVDARPDGAPGRYALTVPPGARALTVSRADGRGVAAHVAIATTADPAWLVDARALRRSGELDGALARVAVGLSGDAGDHARAMGLRGRIHLSRGDFASAEADLRSAIDEGLRLGWISDPAEDAFALAYLLAECLHRAADADVVLDAAAARLDAYPEGRARLAFQRAVAARARGDGRAAVAGFAEGEALASAIGLSSTVRNAREARAALLHSFGRHGEAREALLAIERDDGDRASPCDRLALTNNVAEIERASLGISGGAGDADDVVRRLEEAQRLASTSCPDPRREVTVLTALAPIVAAHDEVGRARKLVARARAILPERMSEPASWVEEAEGRVALAAGAPRQALAAFEREAQLARAVALPYSAWSAAMGEAEALTALGDTARAEAAYARADRAAEDASLTVPLGDGRASFLAERDAAARARILLLLGRGDARGALAVARASQRRLIASLVTAERIRSLTGETRSRWDAAIAAYRRDRAAMDATAARDWALASTSLTSVRAERERARADLRASLDASLAAVRGVFPSPPAREGEEEDPSALLVVLHPLPRGWAVLVRDPAGVRASRVDALPSDPAALADALFAPHAAAFRAATRVRVAAYGEGRRVDVHALPFEGAPLGRERVVEYVLDGEAGAPTRDGGWSALVVADPTEELAAANRGGTALATRLEAGLPVRALVGAEATSAAVMPAVARADLFVFAGHAAVGGHEGLDTALSLAAGGRLTAADVLALDRAPSEVVLTACETARTGGDFAAPGLALSDAFAAAGSRMVIAATRAVADADADALATALFAKGFTPGWDAAAALRDAQRVVAARGGDWAAFRVYVRAAR
jgi:tetratricopeptide (TPR) repeat protein